MRMPSDFMKSLDSRLLVRKRITTNELIHHMPIFSRKTKIKMYRCQKMDRPYSLYQYFYLPSTVEFVGDIILIVILWMCVYKVISAH